MTGNSLLRYIDLIGGRELGGGRREEGGGMREDGGGRKDGGGKNEKELISGGGWRKEGGRESEGGGRKEGGKGRKRMIGGVEVMQINLLNGGDMMITARNVNDGKFERIKTKVITYTITFILYTTYFYIF